MSTGYGWEGLRQVCATLLGARHVPERLCGDLVYLERYNKCSPLPLPFYLVLLSFNCCGPTFSGPPFSVNPRAAPPQRRSGRSIHGAHHDRLIGLPSSAADVCDLVLNGRVTAEWELVVVA